jgi:hypothetical protein
LTYMTLSTQLASKKQKHKEIMKNRKTQQDRQNTQRRTEGKNKDQWVHLRST